MTERQRRALVALRELDQRLEQPDAGGLANRSHRRAWGHSANEIAARAGIDGVPRHGNGAVEGSWSGFTSPALSIASTMTSLVRQKLVRVAWDGRRNRYRLTDKAVNLADTLEKA